MGDTTVRPFGRGATHHFTLFVRSNSSFRDGNLVLPDGGRVHLVRTNPGSGARIRCAPALLQPATPPGRHAEVRDARWSVHQTKERLLDA